MGTLIGVKGDPLASVKVILRKDVPNLGHSGDVKQVAPGYFRNFLLPRGIAVEASEGQLRSLQSVTSSKADQTTKKHHQANALAAQLAEATVQITVKLGQQGRIYGSVTNKDISEAIQQQVGVEIDRHKIELREPLKSIGVHAVPIKLEKGVDTHVNVELVPAAESPS